SFKLPQDTLKRRLLVTIPLFVIGLILTQTDFGIIWRYFGWANQTLATIVLWTAAVYMLQHKKKSTFIALPAAFMTAVVVSYILVAPEGFGLEKQYGTIAGVSASLISLVVYFRYKWKRKQEEL
ncbi:MAG: carbon starvation protein A, partial [Carboxylicivirga sp.]|nr:carbon starvation protein A [Carboxylicivirga sp.]